MLDSDFERLLKTCRITVSKDEKDGLKRDIEQIIDYFDTISELDTKDLQPAYHPVKITGRLRKDEVVKFNDIKGILSNTKTYRFYVVGPKA